MIAVVGSQLARLIHNDQMTHKLMVTTVTVDNVLGENRATVDVDLTIVDSRTRANGLLSLRFDDTSDIDGFIKLLQHAKTKFPQTKSSTTVYDYPADEGDAP